MRKRKLGLLVASALLAGSLTGCGSTSADNKISPESSVNAFEEIPGSGEQDTLIDETVIVLSDNGITVNGSEAGTDNSSSVYLSNDIIYYEDRDTYESGNPYGEGTKEERHSAQAAEAHTVVNIAEAGTYRLQGSLSKGQIRVDLGEEASKDPEAVVTLILDETQITCEVAPAILFLNVYECDNGWSVETAGSTVDTTEAGANLVIADDSVNQVNGSYVARIYKDAEGEKKLWKQDGAIYSYMSMNVDGEQEGTGTLNLTAQNEGLDTELHLTINGGNINIRAQNDGINTNEDGVSVTTINGGDIHIIAGLGEEGDGVDSNGWLVINGGTVIASANPAADAGLDSDMGSFINGGTVVALGSAMDWAESDSEQVTMNLQFASYQASDSAIVITDQEGKYVFAYDPSEDEVIGENIRRYMGAIISCANFAVDDSYHVYIGGTVDGTDVTGVYDVAGIGGYEGGVQQAYTGTDVTRRPMGGFGGDRGGFGGDFGGEGDRGNAGDFGGQRPERQEGEVPRMPGGEVPEGGRPRMPDGEVPEGGRPQMPGGEIPEGGRSQMPGGEIPEGGMPQMPGGEMPQGGGAAMSGGNEVFYMQDKVNFFSGVTVLDSTEKL